MRSGGKVVFQKGTQPLSTEVSPSLIKSMKNWSAQAVYPEESSTRELVVLSPIELSKGSAQVGFGGSYKSVDHIMGNTGEGWFLVLRHDLKNLMSTTSKTFNQLFSVGLFFSLAMAAGAFILGRKISLPIVNLSHWANDISNIGLRTPPTYTANDELGLLTSSVKHMVHRLKETMTSRDNLAYEVEIRKKAELEVSKSLIETQRLSEELKSTQAQMLHREKMASIGQLAAGVAHEINNPIGFVKSNLTSLDKFTAKLREYHAAIDNQFLHAEIDEQVKEQLESLHKKLKIGLILEDMPDLIEESQDGIDRVSVIVKNLKSFSRLDDTSQDYACINECLDSTLKMILSELKYKARILTEYGDIPQISCSAAELNQVFMNLLVNAGHAIEENGEIHIKTWQEDNDIFIRISDNGKGIDTENLNRIFDPFFTTKNPGQGTGLGLSISYDIIQKHNGNIAVESTPGEGTSFTINLPLS